MPRKVAQYSTRKKCGPFRFHGDVIFKTRDPESRVWLGRSNIRTASKLPAIVTFTFQEFCDLPGLERRQLRRATEAWNPLNVREVYGVSEGPERTKHPGSISAGTPAPATGRGSGVRDGEPALNGDKRGP